jgi:hypothetical protein
MKYSKIIIVCALLILGASTIFAQNALVSFMDNTSQTRDYLNMEYPGGSYPAGAGTAANRWKLVIYKSTDNIINPLVNGLPTGDDVILTNPQDNNNPVILDVNIAPGPSGKLNLNAVVVHVSIIPTYIYGRIFNSVDVSTATKYMSFTAPYYVAAGQPVNVNIIPDYGWKTDPVWSLIFPVTDTWTYNLTMTASDNGAYEFTDPQGGVHTTPATLTDGPGDEANGLLGTYTVTSAPPAGFTWQSTTIEVVAGDFTAAKTDYVYNAAKQFVLVPIPDTYTYNLHINGPEGYAVTGPTAELSGTIPYTKTSTVVTDLVGNYTVAAPPAGYQWVMNPINVTADMFQLVTTKNGGMDKVVLGSRTNGAKTHYVYEATITFALELIPVEDVYHLTVTSSEAGYGILKGGNPTGYSTDYTFSAATADELIGTYSLADPGAGFHWVPAEIEVLATDFTAAKGGKVTYSYTINFVKTQTQNEITDITNPPAGVTIEELTNPAEYPTNLTNLDPNAANAICYTINTTGVWNITVHKPDGWLGNWYCWILVGNNNLIGAEPLPISADQSSYTFIGVDFGTRTSGNIYFNQSGFEMKVEGIACDFYNIVDGGSIPPAFLTPSANIKMYTITAKGTWNVKAYRPTTYTGQWYCWFYQNNVLTPAANPIAFDASYTFTDVYFGSDFKGTAQVIFDEYDSTLPVELSGFNAFLTAENNMNIVKIVWTTQTETNMNGFNIYRNDGSDNLASAIQIAYIPATNTSTTQNYEYPDNKDLENGHTYYYWLECVETNGESTFNGPYPIYVNGPTPPVLPEYTKMHNAYPNPFRAGSGTTIAVELKKGDSGTVTIYNILGQVVKTFSLTEGTNNLNWNGRDSKGNLCGNGIYFYKLSTNSLNQTKKMVIVK